ncbi:MAG: Hsp20/alpha crystallin family protein [Planctomycetota bacterium]|jgi:HSP20 family protein
MKDLRWNLSEMVQKIQEDVKKLVKGFSEGDIAAYAMGQWIPRADVLETPDEVRILVDLPGIAPSDVDVTLTGNELKVHGEKSKQEEEDFRFHLNERRHGAFSRTFPLPASVDPQHVAATVRDGLLTITFPKKPESRAREIKVEVQ